MSSSEDADRQPQRAELLMRLAAEIDEAEAPVAGSDDGAVRRLAAAWALLGEADENQAARVARYLRP